MMYYVKHVNWSIAICHTIWMNQKRVVQCCFVYTVSVPESQIYLSSTTEHGILKWRKLVKVLIDVINEKIWIFLRQIRYRFTDTVFYSNGHGRCINVVLMSLPHLYTNYNFTFFDLVEIVNINIYCFFPTI